MLNIVITNKKENRQFTHESGPFEMGRGPQRDVPRFVIDDPFVSGDQLSVEALPGGRVRMTNLSRRIAITFADGTLIPVGTSCEVALPVRFSVGESLIDITQSSEVPSGLSLQTLSSPARRSKTPEKLAALVGLKETPTPEKLTEWFETLVSVQRAAAGSPEFYNETARAIVEVVGLEQGLVLLKNGESWQIAGRYPSESRGGPEFSDMILGFVAKERRTYFQTLTSSMMAFSLMDVSAVVASPIFDADGTDIVGVVYGSRYKMTGGRPVEILPLEAQVVQVLAAAVASGLARLDSESQATRKRVQFEQFFSAELARAIERDPTMLEGREREVTVMFADIRGFSRIAERIGPRDTIRLAGEVMERVTSRIREFDGVVVDYVGDGLLAMWNAPDDDPDHATLACRAAIKMLEELPAIDEAWHQITGANIRLGIGINTGPAMVGNTGSKHRVKYGPLGHTVNLGSRVEGATKYLGVPILVTGSTFDKLGDAFAARRLGRFHVVGIAGEVVLYELVSDMVTPEWQAKRQAYESALALYESGHFQEVPTALYPVLAGQAGRYDVPSLALLGRAIECIKSPPEEFDPVFEMHQK